MVGQYMASENIIAREQRFQRNALIAFVVIALIATLLYSLARGMMAGPTDMAAAFTPAAGQQAPIGAAALPNGAVAGTGVGGPVDAVRRLPGTGGTTGGTATQPGTANPVPGIETPATGTETAGAANTDPGSVGEPPVGQGFLPDTSGVGGGTGTGVGGGGVGGAGPGAGPIDGFSGAGGGGQAGGGPVDPTPPTGPENPTDPVTPTNPTTPTTPTNPTTPTTPTDPVTPTNPVPPVPEPLTWMMLILGVGMAGCALRRERARAGLLVQGAVTADSRA
ncbi:PEPxxWA-CTERM sorting domain-containing protein [Sphingomonas sp. BGYR3]|uniref:PEPxxWA-CTERM sorting domain-containing protein n=1 Tax=Sphingomonas sp. BGYR3 TaxID=2975483 RepID=UPI0021A64643|nr:PEPxxWA-CTERM sorting domain-containing protein [Sphingomonas sp. BGYR3]